MGLTGSSRVCGKIFQWVIFILPFSFEELMIFLKYDLTQNPQCNIWITNVQGNIYCYYILFHFSCCVNGTICFPLIDNNAMNIIYCVSICTQINTVCNILSYYSLQQFQRTGVAFLFSLPGRVLRVNEINFCKATCVVTIEFTWISEIT